MKRDKRKASCNAKLDRIERALANSSVVLRRQENQLKLSNRIESWSSYDGAVRLIVVVAAILGSIYLIHHDQLFAAIILGLLGLVFMLLIVNQVYDNRNSWLRISCAEKLISFRHNMLNYRLRTISADQLREANWQIHDASTFMFFHSTTYRLDIGVVAGKESNEKLIIFSTYGRSEIELTGVAKSLCHFLNEFS